MSDQFLGEIRIFGCGFAPTGWAFCDGQLLPISQNTALFALLGTYYGGDGKSTFALPNLQDSTPLGQGDGAGLTSRSIGESGGEEYLTLINSEMPVHTHAANATSVSGSSNNPTNDVWASTVVLRQGVNIYGTSGGATMSPLALSLAGSSQPHNNTMPYQALNFCIAMQGIFPQRQ